MRPARAHSACGLPELKRDSPRLAALSILAGFIQEEFLKAKRGDSIERTSGIDATVAEMTRRFTAFAEQIAAPADSTHLNVAQNVTAAIYARCTVLWCGLLL